MYIGGFSSVALIIHKHPSGNHDVREILSDQHPFKVDPPCHLLGRLQPVGLQGNHHGVFVYLLKEPAPESVLNAKGTLQYSPGQLLMRSDGHFVFQKNQQGCRGCMG